MAGGLAPILTAVFKKAAGGKVISSILGGAISGYGKSKLEEKRAQREEQYLIDEEKRRQANYEGAADAVNFWTPKEVGQNDAKYGVDYKRARAKQGRGMGAAAGNALQPQPGQQFRARKETPKPRYAFDPQGMGIVRQ